MPFILGRGGPQGEGDRINWQSGAYRRANKRCHIETCHRKLARLQGPTFDFSYADVNRIYCKYCKERGMRCGTEKS